MHVGRKLGALTYRLHTRWRGAVSLASCLCKQRAHSLGWFGKL